MNYSTDANGQKVMPARPCRCARFRWPFWVFLLLLSVRLMGGYSSSWSPTRYPRESRRHHSAYPAHLVPLNPRLQAIQPSPWRACSGEHASLDGTLVSPFHVLLLFPVAFRLLGKTLSTFLIHRKGGFLPHCHGRLYGRTTSGNRRPEDQLPGATIRKPTTEKPRSGSRW